MPPTNINSRPSKNSTMPRKSTRKVLKTARAQQAEPESEEAAPAADVEDVYIDKGAQEAAQAFDKREEEEESDSEEDELEEDKEKLSDEDDEPEDASNEDDEDEDEPQIVQAVPQKRKKGNTKNLKPTSKPFHAISLPCSHVAFRTCKKT
jgi:hypothetical protein